jgi:hypothetical protein
MKKEQYIQIKDYLMKQAFVDPLRDKDEFIKLLKGNKIAN